MSPVWIKRTPVQVSNQEVEVQEEPVGPTEKGDMPSYAKKSRGGQIVGHHTWRARYGHKEPTKISQDREKKGNYSAARRNLVQRRHQHLERAYHSKW